MPIEVVGLPVQRHRRRSHAEDDGVHLHNEMLTLNTPNSESTGLELLRSTHRIDREPDDEKDMPNHMANEMYPV